MMRLTVVHALNRPWWHRRWDVYTDWTDLPSRGFTRRGAKRIAHGGARWQRT